MGTNIPHHDYPAAPNTIHVTAKASNADNLLTRLSRVMEEQRVAIAAVLCALIAVLMFTNPLGVGRDYYNHLARTHIEGWLGQSASLQEFYALRLQFIPDLSMDLIIPWLSHLVGIYPAGTALIILAMVVAPLAGLAISQRLHGDAGGVLPLFGFTTVFGLNLLVGFINFLVANGAALFAFYYWIGAKADWRRTFIVMPLGLALTMLHALAFLLFGFLALVWELVKFWRQERGALPVFVRNLITRDALAFLPGLVYLALSVVTAPDLDMAAGEASLFAQRHLVFFGPFRFGDDPLSTSLATAIFLTLTLSAYAGLRSKRLQMHREMQFVCVALGLLVVVMPAMVMGIWGLHFRFAPALVILVAASTRFRDGALQRQTKIIGSFIWVAVIGAVLFIGTLNITNRQEMAEPIRQEFAALPSGAKILIVGDPNIDDVLTWHIGALAVIEADAYIPGLFTNTSPVDVRQHYRAIHMPQVGPLHPDALYSSAEKATPSASNGYWSQQYYFGWPENFTHVFFLRDDPAKELSGDQICYVSGVRNFAIYRVISDQRACPSE